MSNKGLLIIVIVLLVGIFTTLVIQNEGIAFDGLGAQLEGTKDYVEANI